MLFAEKNTVSQACGHLCALVFASILCFSFLHTDVSVVTATLNTIDENTPVPHGHYCADWGLVKNVHLQVISNSTFRLALDVFMDHIDCSSAYIYHPSNRSIEVLDWHLGACLYDHFLVFRPEIGDLKLFYSPDNDKVVTVSKLGTNDLNPCSGEETVASPLRLPYVKETDSYVALSEPLVSDTSKMLGTPLEEPHSPPHGKYCGSKGLMYDIVLEFLSSSLFQLDFKLYTYASHCVCPYQFIENPNGYLVVQFNEWREGNCLYDVAHKFEHEIAFFQIAYYPDENKVLINTMQGYAYFKECDKTNV